MSVNVQHCTELVRAELKVVFEGGMFEFQPDLNSSIATWPR